MVKPLLNALLAFGYAIWLGSWFWFFTFQYSSSFFQYHLETRLPFLVLSLLVVMVAPVSAYREIVNVVRKQTKPLKAALRHAVVAAAPIGLFWGYSTIRVAISRHTDRLAFEADGAMSIGINFMVCVGIVLLSCVIVAIAVAAIGFVTHGKGAAQ